MNDPRAMEADRVAAEHDVSAIALRGSASPTSTPHKKHVRIKNRRLNRPSVRLERGTSVISHHVRMHRPVHPKLESRLRTHMAPNLLQPRQFAIGHNVEVANLAGEILVKFEMDIPMSLNHISDVIIRYVSLNLVMPMGAISLVWQSGDHVCYTVESYRFWQLDMGYDVHGFCLVCGEDADDVEAREMNCNRCFPCCLCNRCRFTIPDGPCCAQCTTVFDLHYLTMSQKTWIELTDATHMSWLRYCSGEDVLLRYLFLEWADLASDACAAEPR